MNGFNLQTMVDGNICFICSRSTSLATWSMAQGLQQFFLRHVHVYFQATHSMPIGINFSQHAVWHPFFTACRLASTFHSRPIGYFSDILSLSAPCRHHMRSSICFPFSTHPSRFGSHDPGPPPCRRKHG